MTHKGALACCFLALGLGCQASEDIYQQALQALSQGQPEQARALLQQLVQQQPDHAGAWLDIAILYCSIGKGADAFALFDTIEARFSPPAGIQDVINQQRAQGCRGPQPRRSARLQLGRGADSNVNQGVRDLAFTLGSGANQTPLQLDSDYAPKADRLWALAVDAEQALDTQGTTLFAQAQARLYDQWTRFNLQSVGVGVQRPWQLGNWRMGSTASAGWTSLGSTLYQRQQLLQVQATPPVPLAPGWEAAFGVGLGAVQYPTLTGFDSQVLETKATLGYRAAGVQWMGSAGLQYDHGSALRPGNDRGGNSAAVTVRWTPAPVRLPGLTADAGLSRQQWEGRADYAPGLIDRRRNQVTHTATLGARLGLGPGQRQSLRLEYRRVQNDESISLFEFRADSVVLSWQMEVGP